MNSINLRLEDRHLEPLESSLRLGRAFDVTFGGQSVRSELNAARIHQYCRAIEAIKMPDFSP